MTKQVDEKKRKITITIYGVVNAFYKTNIEQCKAAGNLESKIFLSAIKARYF